MKERTDMPSERPSDDSVSPVPFRLPKCNPLLRNKGKVSATPVLKRDNMRQIKQRKRHSDRLNTARCNGEFKDYIGNTLHTSVGSLNISKTYEESKCVKLHKLEGDRDALNKTTSLEFDSKDPANAKPCLPRETYAESKNKLLTSKCVEEFFFGKSYREELAQLLDPASRDAPQPYKYQIEAIEKTAKGRFPLVDSGMARSKL
eukprot:TRINITY_DN4825_c0_g1_i2.p1 TRINITY_DN4825_c0_g1~~TRINITY_DN4825_c0_g1_i2.p1  ORF type:complete len:203 (+),score=40.40 TRINITY_DN4825_c0_g1_i2:108-716(+)